jgi:hypothetical protein
MEIKEEEDEAGRAKAGAGPANVLAASAIAPLRRGAPLALRIAALD